MNLVEASLRYPPMITVEIMTAETGVPFLAGDQVSMRYVERGALEIEVLVARRAGGGSHRDPDALVLAMAGRARFGAELGARLRKFRLKETMHRMGVLLARVTVDARRVVDAMVAEG